METMFMVFGLGFFIYVIFLVERSDEKRYDRRLNEMREFGQHEEQKKNLMQRLLNR